MSRLSLMLGFLLRRYTGCPYWKRLLFWRIPIKVNLKTTCFDRTQPQRAHLFPVYCNSALKNVCSIKIIVKHKEVWKPNTQTNDSFTSSTCIPIARFRGVVMIQHWYPRACSISLFKETFTANACHPRNTIFSRYIFLQMSLLFQNTLQGKISCITQFKHFCHKSTFFTSFCDETGAGRTARW